MKYKVLTYLIIVLGLTSQSVNAQKDQNIEPQDSISNIENQNAFQVKFFKAISQRGIENYEKAVEILESLKNEHSDKAVVFFQLGLNYVDLENYNLALENFKNANALKPDNFDIYLALFEVYEQQKNYTKAIEYAEILATKNPEYIKVLANLYFITKQYQNALDALDNSDKKQGFDAHKDELRIAIFEAYNKPEVAISYYKKRLKIEPYNPLNAYRLIEFFIQSQQYNKALNATEELIKNHPRFTRVQVLKIKIHLNLNETESAFEALKVVVSDRFLDEKYKMQALEAIKAYVEKHPEYQNQFVQILNLASETAENSASFLDLGLFYFDKDKPRALKNFKKALKQNPQDFQILKNIAVLELQLDKTQSAIETANQALDIYPTQAVFMLIKGEALLYQTQYKAAKTVLLDAQTYIFEENKMLLSLYENLQKVYKGLNNLEQSKLYQTKAEQLKAKLQ